MRKQFDRNDRSHVQWLDNAVKDKVHKLCEELEADLTNKGRITYETGVEKCHHIADFTRLTGRG